MLWMMVALAEEAGTKIEPDFGSWDTQLAELIATDTWYRAPAQLDTADPVVLLKALLDLDETKLVPTDGALAWQQNTDEFSRRIGSNLRVKHAADGSVAAIAFAVTQTDDGGRAMSVDNDDVLVVYSAGVPTHVFQTHVGRTFLSTWEKTLWTFARDANGLSALEVKSDHDFHEPMKPTDHSELRTVHSTRRLTL